MEETGEGQLSEPFKIVGKIYLSGDLREGAILIREGKVWLLGKHLSNFNVPEFRLGDHEVALPGMVDLHVHVRGLDLSHKEDWYTGTLSALKGGVTFIGDMPNTVPRTVTLEALEKKVMEARKDAVVDYGVYFGVPNSFETYKEAIEKGILGLKIYPEDFYSPLLIKLLKLNTQRNLLTIVHAEDPKVLEKERKGITAEIKAVKHFSSISTRYDVNIHITHLSSSRSLEIILKSNLKGGRLSWDVTPHHVFLNKDMEFKLGGLAEVRPPLRSEEDRLRIYNSLKHMLADAYVTDHAPHTLDEKLSESPPPGFPGLEVGLHLLVNEILEGRMSWNVLDLYSSRPARLIGIPKGEVTPGNDADIVIVDTKAKWRIRGEEFVSKAKYTPFEGQVVKGRVTKVFIRGTLAYDGEVIVKKGYGVMYGKRT